MSKLLVIPSLILLALADSLKAGPVVLPAGDLTCHIGINRRSAETPSEPVSSKRARATTIKVTRAGKITRFETNWSDGRSTEAWRDASSGQCVEQDRNGNVYVRPDGTMRIPRMACLNADSIGWIRTEDLRGEVGFEGRKCFHYQREIIFPEDTRVIYQAWIDKETGSIAALDDESATYTFTFSALPAGVSLVIPPVFQKELDRYAKLLQPPRHL